ncbi:MAG: hypothetical protein LUQ69_03255 [Methanoregulaceae archaeon]|nr:hypothetical protein [Methanoregulaceae archaeon]
MKPMVLLTAILLIAGTILAAGCVQQPAGPPATATPTTATTTIPTATPVPPVDSIGVANTSSLGSFLVDARGMTLYYFTKDSPGTGNSSCYNQCAVIWPIFHVTTIHVSPPLSAAEFGEITRTTGEKQTTFRGWPLYFYQNDTAPGETTGQGVNGIWFVVSPSGVVTLSPTTPASTVPTTAPTTTVRTTIPDSGSDSGSSGGGY